MTGFGSADGTVLGGRLRVEIRTVNHRYFNPQFKLPSELLGGEGPLRERLRQPLDRGHGAGRAGDADARGAGARGRAGAAAGRARSGARAVEERAPARLAAEHERLKKAVSELAAGAQVDEQRLAIEIALMADRVDITEEL